METVAEVSPRPLLVVGGNLALDFANTVDDPRGPYRFDHAGTASLLLRWARDRGVLDEAAHGRLLALAEADPTTAARVLRRAWRLRTSIQDVVTALADACPVPDPAWQDLRRVLADAVAHADLEPGAPPPRLACPVSDLHAVLRAVALAAHGLLTGGELDRVKHCVACHWLFVDRSKNGSRRWCTMEDCGKNAKMRRYVERRAARRRPGS